MTPLKTSSPSPIKITTPQSWQITSTPTSIKRSVSEIEDSHVLENSPYHHGRMKRKCVRSLKFAEHSSQTQSDSSWSESRVTCNLVSKLAQCRFQAGRLGQSCTPFSKVGPIMFYRSIHCETLKCFLTHIQHGTRIVNTHWSRITNRILHRAINALAFNFLFSF